MSLKELDEDIKNKKLHGFYLLYGEEKYTLETYIEKMKKCYDNLSVGLNFFVLDKTSIESLVDLCDSVSFFGLQKLIIIKDIGLKINKDILENINNPELVIIFVESNVDKRTSEYKYLVKKANVVEFTKMNEKEAIFFVKKTLNAYNIMVPDDVATYLVNVCTPDRLILINEFRKIVAYMNSGDTLNKGIIDKICSRTLDAKVFDLMDLIMSKKKEEALCMFDDIINQNTYVGIVSAMMFKQLKQIYQIKLLEEISGHLSSSDMAKELNIHPFVFSKLKAVSSLYTKENLESIILEFDEYDENSKTGKIDIIMGLKKLILKI